MPTLHRSTVPVLLTGLLLAACATPERDTPVGGQGQTLYVFTADQDGERTCTGACLQTWPILSSDDELPTVDGEVREELVGTIPGDHQVTYSDQPLYSYEGDDAVGDLTGQGRGGQWFAVSPEGIPLEGELD